MEVSSRVRNAFLTALGILGALVLVAIASRGSTSAGEGGVRRPSDALVDVLVSLYVAALVLGGAMLLYGMLLQRRLRTAGGEDTRRSWWNGLGGLILAAGVLLLLRQRAPEGFLNPFSPAAAEPPEVPVITRTSGGADSAAGRDSEFAWIPVSITLALLALAAFGIWWSGRARRRVRGELRGSLLADEVAAAVDESLDDLRSEPDPRRAVIAAYARLERVLAAYGLPRAASEAPIEYLRRMLAQLSVSPQAAGKLTRLFERAKFSQHAVGQEMKEQAISALETVRDDLAAARALAEQQRTAALTAMRERAAR